MIRYFHVIFFNVNVLIRMRRIGCFCPATAHWGRCGRRGCDFAHKISDFVKVTLLVGPHLSFGTVNNVCRIWASFVFFQMSVQIRLLTETTIAKWTFERFFFVVNVSYVSLKIRTDWKRPLTIFAFVGLFTWNLNRKVFLFFITVRYIRFFGWYFF